MRTNFLNTSLIVFILALAVSCKNDKPLKELEVKPKKHLTEAEKTELERASFDKLPDNNLDIAGCWMINHEKSAAQLWNADFDAFFFFKEHKRFSIYDSTEMNISESMIGFYRYYNSELTFEINEGEPFQDVWRIKVKGGQMTAENKRNPNQIIYLDKINKRSRLTFK